jgi:hypothetical protein
LVDFLQITLQLKLKCDQELRVLKLTCTAGVHFIPVTALNTTVDEDSVFGHVNVLQPQASRQFLYCLAPQASLTSDLRLLTGATNIGKLDIVWRSNLGERGRLQTSQLQRMVC